MTKTCCKCKLDKPLEDFHRSSKARDGRQNRCKPCRKGVDAEKYKSRTLSQQGVYALREKERQRGTKLRVLEYLREHPCVDCGEDDPVVLEFDHVRGDKEGNIGCLINDWSWERLRIEIEKCDVRCANCHRRRTYKQFAYHRHLT